MSRPTILDPLSVPVIGTDAHLPPVPAQRLQAAALREQFGAGVTWEPEIPGDGRLFTGREPAAAALKRGALLGGSGIQRSRRRKSRKP